MWVFRGCVVGVVVRRQQRVGVAGLWGLDVFFSRREKRSSFLGSGGDAVDVVPSFRDDVILQHLWLTVWGGGGGWVLESTFTPCSTYLRNSHCAFLPHCLHVFPKPLRALSHFSVCAEVYSSSDAWGGGRAGLNNAFVISSPPVSGRTE